jgi:Na+:H+ antiporter, NhaA family
MYRVSPFMRRFALSLAAGVGAATIWANFAPASYYDMIEWRLYDVAHLGQVLPSPITLTPLHLVAEVFIAFFLFLIGKELWEAIVLERGGFAGRAAALPIAGTLGAALGAVLVWVVLARLIDPDFSMELAKGWVLPVGGDVVLAYLFGMLAFDRRSNALRLLLLVMIAQDMLGLILLGLTHPTGGLLRLTWLLLPVLASIGVWYFHARPMQAPHISERDRLRAGALWPYVLAGFISYVGVVAAGLPGALGLLPIIPAIAHANHSFGLFAQAEELLHDPLNRMAHALIWPITLILFAFGLTHGGIDFAAFSPPTLLVLAAYWLGKPLGFLLGTWGMLRFGGVIMPQDVSAAALWRVALLLGIGFSVPVLALDSALEGGALAEAARLGLALTLGFGLISLILPRR